MLLTACSHSKMKSESQCSPPQAKHILLHGGLRQCRQLFAVRDTTAALDTAAFPKPVATEVVWNNGADCAIVFWKLLLLYSRKISVH